MSAPGLDRILRCFMAVTRSNVKDALGKEVEPIRFLEHFKEAYARLRKLAYMHYSSRRRMYRVLSARRQKLPSLTTVQAPLHVPGR